MGGLKDDIALEIWMFKPKALLEAIELARIRDESVDRRDDKTRQINHKQIRQPFQTRVSIQPTHLDQKVKQMEL